MTRINPLKLIQIGLSITLALSHLTLDKRLQAQQPRMQHSPPPPNAVWEPAPSVGTCSRCGNWRWTDALGQPCQSFTCLGPGWPLCAGQLPNSHICTPSEQFNVTQCAITGVETCSYTCNAQGTGYGAPTCQAIGNGGNFRRTFCDYNAGCPVGNGFAQGRPTTVSELCTQNGTLQTVTYGACGTAGCNRRLVCKPGVPCHNPEETPPQCQWQSGLADLVPTCGPGSSGYECRYGRLTLSVGMPCPSVVRKPFPRGIVGQPMQFQIVNACADLPSASGHVDVPQPWDACGDTIVAYEGELAWQCSDTASATWTMDERAWNLGHIGQNGQPIAAERHGGNITHVYETSSYDLPPNGPGYPDPLKRQPAYQVQLKTNYSLVGAFRYQYRAQERRCYDDTDKTQQRTCRDSGYCDNPGFPERKNEWQCRPEGASETVIITPTRQGPAIVIPSIEVHGAKTPQDPGNPNTCGVIAVPVIANQSIIRP